MSPPASKRKRHSAFDDFPVENVSDGQASQKLPFPEADKPSGADETAVERIERLKPSQIVPDRFQPRRLLPASIRDPFFSGEIDCYEAAERWLSISRQDKAHAAIIERLISMAASFDNHGQIKPITGSWENAPDGRYVFVIETGERRFWAACLMAVRNQAEEEPLLRVEAINNPSRQRQVLENRHAEMPSAVSQACEIASLILAEMGIAPESGHQDEYDYFRMARAQRMPAGLWEKIKPVMQLTRPRMVQLLNILQMPTSLLELADRYRLPERVLREVLSLPHGQWDRAIMLSIQNQLSSDEVIETVTAAEESTPAATQTVYEISSAKQKKPPASIAASGLRRFANTLLRLDGVNQSQAFDELANDLVVAGDAERMLSLFDELSPLIRARLKRR